MRRRLVLALVGITFAVIALYGVPRVYFLAHLVRDQEQSEINHSADLVAATLAERAVSGRPVTSEFLTGLLEGGEGMRMTPEDGPVLIVGTPGDGEGDVVQSRTIDGVGVIELWRPGDQVGDRVSQAMLPLVLLGLGLLVLSALVGSILARRLARPFQELSEVADQLGQGRFDTPVPHYAIPEAEAIGGALRQAAGRLDTLLGREREFAVNASHQVLTPLAALRLELEDLRLRPETPLDVADQLDASLVDVDRLTDAVKELLSSKPAAADGSATEVDLVTLTDQVVERWQRSTDAGGQELAHTTVGAVTTHISPDVIVAILDVLLDNAIKHGAGRITVDATQFDTHLCLQVSDEGSRSVPSDVLHRPRGTDPQNDRGLARAAELAESVGGHLRIGEAEQTTMVLMLPRRG